MAVVVLVGRAEGAESCLLHQAASWKLSLCTVPVLNHPLNRRDFLSLSVLNNDLHSGCIELVGDVVLLLKAPRTRGSLGARNWLYQLAFAVELVMTPLGGGYGLQSHARTLPSHFVDQRSMFVAQRRG